MNNITCLKPHAACTCQPKLAPTQYLNQFVHE